MRRRTRLWALPMVLVGALLLSGCDNPAGGYSGPANNRGHQVEDCDADDLLEGDEDCYGFGYNQHRTTPKTGPRSSYVKPAPRKNYGSGYKSYKSGSSYRSGRTR